MVNSNLFSYAGVSNTGLDITIIVLFLVVGIALLLLTVYLLTRFIYKPKVKAAGGSGEPAGSGTSFSFGGMFWALAAFGIILRLIFVFAIRGYRGELNQLTDLIVGTTKFNELYTESNSLSSHPVVIYLYSFLGLIAKSFSVTASSAMMPFFVKLPLVICDIITAGVIYKAAKKYINEYCALILSGFVMLFPAFIFASSVWGSVFSLYTMIIVLCFYFIANKNFLALIGIYSVALLTVKDALYVYPVVAIFIIYNYIKLCIALYKSPKSFGEIMADKELRHIVLVPCAIVLMMIVSYLITLPLMINVSANFFRWIYVIFFYPLADIGLFGHNALNVFNLFVRNGISLEADFPAGIFAALFAVIATALVALVYLSRKNRANLSFLAAYIILTLSIFFMGFTELNLIPAIALMILSFVLIRDRRILKTVGLLGFCVLFNASAVMAAAGYLNNLPASDLSSSNSAYTGVTLLTSGGALAVSIICSLMVIITFVYATFILLDLSMSNKRKLLEVPVNNSFLAALKNFFKI